MAGKTTFGRDIQMYLTNDKGERIPVGELQSITFDTERGLSNTTVLGEIPRSITGTLKDVQIDMDALFAIMTGKPAPKRDNEHYAEKNLREW